MRQTWAMCISGIVVAAAAGLSGHQLQTPTDWKWRFDRAAEVTSSSGAADASKLYFVAMPPGWHMTGGPGALLFHPDYQGKGNFALEMEVFLFPDSGDQEYGVFVGGRTPEPSSTSPEYTAFLLRRDGHAAVVRRGAGQERRLVDWIPNSSAVAIPAGGKDDVKNVLRVDVGAVDVVFSANGKEIAKVLRNDVSPEGQFGFRVGPGVNLHTSQLSVTYKLAPVRK